MGRRFAPVPIETTFNSHKNKNNPDSQRIGPNPELTPEQSPRSPSPPPPPPSAPATAPPRDPPKRRFAPQLIETSRRARRSGDAGPATKQTDKTDFTPWVSQLHSVARARPRRAWGVGGGGSFDSHTMAPTRRETEDESVTDYLLDLAAKEAERRIQEVALSAFPNSGAREGGVAHFYYDDGSMSDNEETQTKRGRGPPKARRKESDNELDWWQKQMQKHAEQVAQKREKERAEDEDVDMASADLGIVDLSSHPEPLLASDRLVRQENRRQSSARTLSPIRESGAASTATPSSVAPAVHHTPHHAAHHASQHAPPHGGFRAGMNPFGRPFGGASYKADDAELKKMREAASPPMLGKDLTFRTCPSPQLTKLETDHSFAKQQQVETFRDTSGKAGLWRGYCFRSESQDGYLVPAELKPAPMISTPYPPATPRNPPASYFDAQHGRGDGQSSDEEMAQSPVNNNNNNHERPDLLLNGLDERLRREKSQAEKEDKIAQEFDDEFVTQVYNYLSLGYPAMARGFDEELSKISRFDADQLKKWDRQQMAKGHMLEMKLEETTEEDRDPRWKALRIYILEWARQHPNLDNFDPMAWGVRERRGSWGI